MLDFSKSFRPVRDIRAGESCKLKNHFSHVLREVIGYLDKKGDEDPERKRFAFCGNAAILKNCHRYKGPQYNARMIQYALSYLAANFIITAVEQIRFGRKMRGWYVMPHDALAKRVGNCCEWREFPDDWREPAERYINRKSGSNPGPVREEK